VIVVVLKVMVVLVGRGGIMAVMQTEKQKKCGGVQGLLSRQSTLLYSKSSWQDSTAKKYSHLRRFMAVLAI